VYVEVYNVTCRFIFVRLGGILAGYGKLTITKPNAETFFNLSDIHVEVEGDFFIFTPEVGQELVGKFSLYCVPQITSAPF